MESLKIIRGESQIYTLTCRYCLKYFIQFHNVYNFKTASFPGAVVDTFNASVNKADTEVDRLCQFKARLFYISNSRPTKATL